MGTKRAFDEELQEFIKHPKNLDYAYKSPLFEGSDEDKHDDTESENDVSVPGMFENFKTTVPLPLVTGVRPGPVPVPDPDLFAALLENNLPRKPLLRYEDAYASLLNKPPRKQVPIGPAHQAHVPDFDPELARNYPNDGALRFRGVFVIPAGGEARDIKTGCTCFDHGSVRCVRQHVKEARLSLRESLGPTEFGYLGMVEMGEAVVRSGSWAPAHEQLFCEVVYSTGKMFWEELSVAFPARTKKELVSYYFNVFVLRKRAIQNRSRPLEVNSDGEDEWPGSEGGLDNEVRVENAFQGCDGNGCGPLWSTGRPTKDADLLSTRRIIKDIFG